MAGSSWRLMGRVHFCLFNLLVAARILGLVRLICFGCHIVFPLLSSRLPPTKTLRTAFRAHLDNAEYSHVVILNHACKDPFAM